MRPGFRLAASLLFLLSAACLLLFLVLDLFRSGQKDWVPLETGGTAERRVVMLVVDRLDYATLRAGAGPALQELLKQSALSLLNARAGRSTSESGYLSLGSGVSRCRPGGEAFERDEKYDEESAGEVPAPHRFASRVASWCISAWRNCGKRTGAWTMRFHSGCLDKSWLGLQAAVFGNADTSTPGRSAVLIAMDQSGTVSLGRIGTDPGQDPLAPYGKRTTRKAWPP